jgi:hypothetical protein
MIVTNQRRDKEKRAFRLRSDGARVSTNHGEGRAHPKFITLGWSLGWRLLNASAPIPVAEFSSMKSKRLEKPMAHGNSNKSAGTVTTKGRTIPDSGNAMALTSAGKIFTVVGLCGLMRSELTPTAAGLFMQ